MRDPEIEFSAGTCLPYPSYQVRVLARSGDEPPERPGEVFTTFTDPDLNDADQVVFKGNFDGPASGNEGLYRWDPTGEQLLRVVDDSFDSSPPGQSGATSWTSFGPPVLNEAGHVLFHGNFSFGDNSQGLYVFTDTDETVIFDDNPTQPVPGQPTAQGFTTFPFSAGRAAAALGRATSVRPRRASSTRASVEREGVYSGDSLSGIVQVADETLAPPGQPASTFETFDWFMATNGPGDVALHAEYTNGGHGIYRFVQTSRTLLRVADTRMIPPGQSDPSKFSLIDGFPSMNDTGTVAFRASYTNGTGNQGIYRGTGVGPPELVVDNSGAFAVPGQPGVSFLDFGLPALNATGDIVFSVTHTTGFGIYRSSSGTLTTILDSGDAVPHQPGATFFALGVSPSRPRGTWLSRHATREDPATKGSTSTTAPTCAAYSTNPTPHSA